MKQLPEILVSDLEHLPAFNRQAFTDAHAKAAVTSVRLNPRKATGVFKDNDAVPWCSNGRYLPQRPVFTVDPFYHAGAYYVQEASSMFLHHMLGQVLPQQGGLRVLDLCAAPGGKSTLIASLLTDDSLLISNEVIRSRATILEENMTRWGHMNTWVTSNDPKDLGKLEGYFDVIVVDAPCSGSGLFRKDERALEEWSEGNVNLCAQRQQRILADVWPALKTDGVLIYATCSYSQQEDEDILDWMGADLEVESLAVPVPEEWNIVETSSPQQGLAGYRFFPDRVGGEGFFIAAVRKTSEEQAAKPARFKSQHDPKNALLCAKYLHGADWVCLPGKEEYVAVHPAHEPDIQLLSKYVYLRKTGTRLGNPVKKDWLPAHDLALSIWRHSGLPVIAANKEQALKFLKKEDSFDPYLPKGWYFVTYENQGLGWIKAIGNRLNNYLPAQWRIRMEIGDADWA